MLRTKTPFASLALLLALTAAPLPLVSVALRPALAQSASPTPFRLPSAVPSGTALKVDGSTSMELVNQDLKRRYEERYSGTTVDLAAAGTDKALEALLAGTVDVAAIGRPLTAAEKSKGLSEVRLPRQKIAIIVGANNPFKGNLTFEQFAKIFRGEITNWSQVGGPNVPIRFVDRPDYSDTRLGLSRYKVFQSAPFQTGATATQVADDETLTVVKELGTDGISYAIVSQVTNVPDVRIVPMHQTLPTDPRYPFSQYLAYIYKGTPTPAVVALLGFATAPAGKELVESAAAATAAAAASPSPAAAASPGETPAAAASAETPAAIASPDADAVPPAATAADPSGGFPWWLLLLPILGLAAWAWWKSRGGAGAAAGSEVAPPVSPPPAAAVPPVDEPAEPSELASRAGSVIASDRAVISGAAAPSVNGAGLAAGALAAGAGVAALGALASDRTVPKSRIILTPRNSEDGYAYWEAPDEHKAELRQQGGKDLKLRIFDVTDQGSDVPLQEYAVAEADQDRHVPIPQPDRDYAAEIGYTTDDGTWLSLARSNPIRVSAVAPVASAIGAAALGSSMAAGPDFVAASEVPVESVTAPEPVTASGSDLTVESDLPSAPELSVPPITPDSPSTPETPSGFGLGGLAAGLVAGGAAIAGAAALGLGDDDEQSTVEATKFDVGQTDLSSETLADVDDGLADLPEGYGESRIVLLPRDPQWAYTYWDTPYDHKQALRQQGGERLALRLYDVTDIDIESQRPHSLQQYDCDEMARNWYLPIPVSDRDYLVEIGYLAADGRWLLLARSNMIRIPPVFPSDWFEDQFTTIAWDEDLRGRTFATLIPPSQRTTDTGNPLYDEIFDMAQSTEAQRVAGSLFGSMQMAFGSQQMVPEQAISSYVFPSGVGMWAVPTVSGLTMSGAGIAGSMPPIRARKFWLVADAELIVYGATEPDATVTIGGRPIKLNPDGTFRFQMSFQDGLIDFPIMAVAADGEQSRSIHMKFTRETPERNTNTKEEAKDEWF